MELIYLHQRATEGRPCVLEQAVDGKIKLYIRRRKLAQGTKTNFYEINQASSVYKERA